MYLEMFLVFLNNLDCKENVGSTQREQRAITASSNIGGLNECSQLIIKFAMLVNLKEAITSPSAS